MKQYSSELSVQYLVALLKAHNIKRVIATGELFEDYGEDILPLAQKMLDENTNSHIREIHIRHYKTGHNYGWKGLVQLSSDSITGLLV